MGEIGMKNILTVIARSGMMDRESHTWTRELWQGTMDAVLAILLSLLPNLTTLCLGPNLTKETRILSTMLAFQAWKGVLGS